VSEAARFGTFDSGGSFAIAKDECDFALGIFPEATESASASEFEPRPLKSTPMRFFINRKRSTVTRRAKIRGDNIGAKRAGWNRRYESAYRTLFCARPRSSRVSKGQGADAVRHWRRRCVCDGARIGGSGVRRAGGEFPFEIVDGISVGACEIRTGSYSLKLLCTARPRQS